MSGGAVLVVGLDLEIQSLRWRLQYTEICVIYCYRDVVPLFAIIAPASFGLLLVGFDAAYFSQQFACWFG